MCECGYMLSQDVASLLINLSGYAGDAGNLWGSAKVPPATRVQSFTSDELIGQ